MTDGRDRQVLDVWGHELDVTGLDREALEYLKALPPSRPSIEWIWAEMDRVWAALGLDNRHHLESQQIGDFYSHPVWVVNGIFSATDPDSIGHRESIAAYIQRRGPRSIIDFGGGFGELACRIKEACPDASVAVFDQFPSDLTQSRLSRRGVSVVGNLTPRSADVVIAQDVLEHVERPLDVAFEVASLVRSGGIAVFANSFYPEIECHLPRTFYLRHTFRLVMKAAGLGWGEPIPGASHALAYEVPTHTRLRSGALARVGAKPLGVGLNWLADQRRTLRNRSWR